MAALFTNESVIEKITSFAGFGHEKQKRRSTIIVLATVIMVGIAFSLVFLIPREYRFVAALLSALLFGAAIVGMWLKVPKSTGSGSAMTGMGLLRTGDSVTYRYEFFEDRFTASTDTTWEYPYSQLISVRDIGGAFQMKTPQAAYTVKKKGFSEGGLNAFKELMTRNRIQII